MPPPIPIPDDVRGRLRQVFADCNARVAKTISDMPTTHEVALDMTLIQHFIGLAAPCTLTSGWTVRIATHYLGGGRHYGEWGNYPRRWEVADIGVLVMFREAGKLVRTKVALLQSKRLYPNEQEWEEDTPIEYGVGFRRLFESDDDWGDVAAPRRFSFTEDSRYKALHIGAKQYNAMTSFENQQHVPIHYMLYHPLQIPSAVAIPVEAPRSDNDECEVGCRIVPAANLRAAAANWPVGYSPAYSELRDGLGEPFIADHAVGWALENFVADLLIECDEGYIAEGADDAGLNYVFYRRTAPISSAIAITLDAPAPV
jgi:hypothetical protein